MTSKTNQPGKKIDSNSSIGDVLASLKESEISYSELCRNHPDKAATLLESLNSQLYFADKKIAAYRNSLDHNAVDAAYRILQITGEKGFDVSMTKLIRLVYIAQGYLLGAHRKILFSDPVTASEYGPSISRVYNQFRSFDDHYIEVPNLSALTFSFSAKAEEVMSFVIVTYGSMKAMELVNLTCQKKTPWHGKYQKSGPTALISNESIRMHYLKVLSDPDSVNGL